MKTGWKGYLLASGNFFRKPCGQSVSCSRDIDQKSSRPMKLLDFQCLISREPLDCLNSYFDTKLNSMKRIQWIWWFWSQTSGGAQACPNMPSFAQFCSRAIGHWDTAGNGYKRDIKLFLINLNGFECLTTRISPLIGLKCSRPIR